MASPFVSVGWSGGLTGGPIVSDHNRREWQIRHTQDIVTAVDRLPEEALIVAGWWRPRVRVMLDDRGRTDPRYMYLMDDSGSVRRLIAEGRRIYYVDEMDAFNLQARGVDLVRLGARRLPPAPGPAPPAMSPDAARARPTAALETPDS